MIDPGQVTRILRVATTVDVNEAVTAAQSVLDSVSTPLYTDEKRDLIGAWIAAHFFEPDTLIMKKVGEAINQYAIPKSGLGLQSGRFGRMAMTLDTSRYFSGIGKRAPKLEALGPVEPNSTDADSTETL